VRNGLEVAKLIAVGAQMVGAAQPFLKAAVDEVAGDSGRVVSEFRVWKKELQTALFCTGSKNLNELNEKKVIYESR
jgi:isopentenyl-diphosphate delta-isomerase